MPLSLSKLKDLLFDKHLIFKQYYSLHSYITFIEVVYTKTAESFLLYISNEYHFYDDTIDREDLFKIKLINREEDNLTGGVSKRNNIAEKYAKSPDNFDIEDKYDEINLEDDYIDSKHNNTDKTFENRMVECYKRPVWLCEISKEDETQLREIIRQIYRLNFCTKNIRYSISIQYKNYLCVLNKEKDTIDCYLLKNGDRDDNSRKLLIVADLELLYEKLNTIITDILQVNNGIFNVLNKNQKIHTNSLDNMIQKRTDIIGYSNLLLYKKNEYNSYIEKYKILLQHITDKETIVYNDIINIDRIYSETNQSFNKDINISHAKNKKQEELRKILVAKEKVLSNIIKLKKELNNINLITDKILFDNIIMLDTILKNFNQLENLLK